MLDRLAAGWTRSRDEFAPDSLLQRRVMQTPVRTNEKAAAMIAEHAKESSVKNGSGVFYRPVRLSLPFIIDLFDSATATARGSLSLRARPMKRRRWRSPPR